MKSGCIMVLFLSTIAMALPIASCEKHPDNAALQNRSSTGSHSDNTLTQDVKTALLKDSSLSQRDFKVRTVDGVVSILGFVASQDEAGRAIALAQAVEGVKSVASEIEVQPAPPSVANKTEDRLLAEKVRHSLATDPVLRMLEFSVSAHNGEVTLNGHVEREGQASAIVSAARKVKGVHLVVNEISIQQRPNPY